MEFKEQYLSYDEYKGLGGNLDQTPFNLLEFEARKIVDKNTLGKLINLKVQKQETKLCIYKLINEIERDNKSKGISSQSVGSYSVNYGTITTKDQETKYNAIVQDLLGNCFLENGIPYLYSGV